MERNLARLAAYCRELGINVRPHTKIDNIPERACRQITGGAVEITAAKLEQADIMVAAGNQGPCAHLPHRQHAALWLPQAITGIKIVELRGVMFYPAHLLVSAQQHARIKPANVLRGKTLQIA